MNETPPATTAKNQKTYENNPFFVATTGLDLLFKKARSIGILLAVLSGFTALSRLQSNAPHQVTDKTNTVTENQAAFQSFIDGLRQVPLETWLLVGLLVVVCVALAMAIGIVVRGIIDYTASRIAVGKTATITEAFRAVLSNFWGYTWVLVIVSVKTLLWTLLFIIPGIIMAVRYSLAGVAYFDKGLKGNESVKHSMALTKDAWLTTFASMLLPNILTFGIISVLLQPGTNAVLYRQYSGLATKPKAHTLSWLTLILPIVFSILFITVIIAFLMLLAQQLKLG